MDFNTRQTLLDVVDAALNAAKCVEGPSHTVMTTFAQGIVDKLNKDRHSIQYGIKDARLQTLRY